MKKIIISNTDREADWIKYVKKSIPVPNKTDKSKKIKKVTNAD